MPLLLSSSSPGDLSVPAAAASLRQAHPPEWDGLVVISGKLASQSLRSPHLLRSGAVPTRSSAGMVRPHRRRLRSTRHPTPPSPPLSPSSTAARAPDPACASSERRSVVVSSSQSNSPAHLCHSVILGTYASFTGHGLHPLIVGHMARRWRATARNLAASTHGEAIGPCASDIGPCTGLWSR